jgi:hypothetical protein
MSWIVSVCWRYKKERKTCLWGLSCNRRCCNCSTKRKTTPLRIRASGHRSWSSVNRQDRQDLQTDELKYRSARLEPYI